jgi:hypothetical protein
MKLRLLIMSLLVAAPCAGVAQEARMQRELLVFPSAEIVRSSGLAQANEDLDDELFSADVLFSLQKDKFRLFAEYLLTNHEADMERLQLGWEPTADTTVWLGRFHQASSVWNHEHHHGRFLQTSITRPAIENWEDDGGVIPQHFLGVLVESNWHLGGGRGLHTAIGGGSAPVLGDGELEPFDVVHPSVHGHQPGYQARITFLPDELGETGVGLLLAHNEINWEDGPPPQLAGVGHVDQQLIGVFGSLVHEPWALSGVLYDVRTKMEGSAADDDRFFVGYLQVEREMPHGLTLFGRYEDTSGERDVAYLTLFPDYVTYRAALGLRWAIGRRHAVTFETADSQTAQDHFAEFRLQWSAVLF